MKTTKTKTFDAVTESRRWKAAVSRQTADMTREEVLAFFNKERVLAALGEMRAGNEQTCIVREDLPKK